MYVCFHVAVTFPAPNQHVTLYMGEDLAIECSVQTGKIKWFVCLLLHNLSTGSMFGSVFIMKLWYLKNQ